MIIFKFIAAVFIFMFCLSVFFRLFGRPIIRYLVKVLAKRAQADLDRRARNYDQFVDDHNPFEDSIYVDDGVKVSVRRGQKEKEEKSGIDLEVIETVEYEDID